MTPHFIPIYGSAILAICTLALFASHNRKTGWKKQKSRFAQRVNAFYEGAYVEGSTAESAFREPSTVIPILNPFTAAQVTDFSQQLIKLRASLGTAGKAPDFETARVVRETVRR